MHLIHNKLFESVDTPLYLVSAWNISLCISRTADLSAFVLIYEMNKTFRYPSCTCPTCHISLPGYRSIGINSLSLGSPRPIRSSSNLGCFTKCVMELRKN
jgi:hypothetical protein